MNPIVVSTERPSRTAASDAPAPRWQVTIRTPSRARAEQLRRPPRRIRVREAVEAVLPQVPALPPLGRDRVGRRRRRHRGVEGGVEAGDRRHVRQGRLDRLERGKRLRLVERGQIGERPESLDDLAVDAHRPRVQRPAVDDPVADRVHRPEPRDGPCNGDDVGLAAGRGQVRRLHDPIVAGRAPGASGCSTRVDDEDPHVRSALSAARPRSGSRARPRPPGACRPAPAGAGRPSAGERGRPAVRGRGRGRSRPSPGGTGRGR